MKYQMLLGLGGLAAVSAHPQRRAPNTNNALSKRGVDISKYSMPDLGSYAKTSSLEEGEMTIVSSDYVETAKNLVKQKFPDLEFRTVDDHYVGSNGVGHVNFKQTVHGIDIDNADFHVNVSNALHIRWDKGLNICPTGQERQGLLSRQQLLHRQAS